FRQDLDSKPRGLWLAFKTYAPTGALLLMMGASQFHKFPLMSAAIDSRRIYTVKALQATGVPFPFLALEGAPPTGFRRWIRKILLPYGQRRFQPYSYSILQSYEMTEFLIEKGFDINTTRLIYGGELTPPGIGGVTMT